jgi:predicted ATPase
VLKRLYIDNYKCFANFEWKPDPVNLLLGGNGSGKSTVFEVLTKLQSIVFDDARVSEVFPSSSLTAWDSRGTQRFEIEWAPPGVVASSYVLEVEHDREKGISRIKSETLSFEGTRIYVHDGTNVTVAGDEDGPPVTFPFSGGRSYLSTVDSPMRESDSWDGPSARFATTPRATLRVWKWLFAHLRVYKLDVAHIGGRATDTATSLRSDGLNFATWYASKLQERPELMFRSQQDLSEIINGLSALRIVPSARGGKQMVATFTTAADDRRSTKYDLPFDELSDGQRALIVLYAILHVEAAQVLCFDEPDNFVALPEIQPWLVALSASAEPPLSAQKPGDLGANQRQVFIISHHPEIIDYLAAGGATVFERVNGGPARIRPLLIDRALGLKASEILARGWDDAT